MTKTFYERQWAAAPGSRKIHYNGNFRRKVRLQPKNENAKYNIRSMISEDWTEELDPEPN